MSKRRITRLIVVLTPVTVGLAAWAFAGEDRPARDLFGVTMPGRDEIVGSRPMLQGRVPPGSRSSVTVRILRKGTSGGPAMERSVPVSSRTWALRVSLAPGEYVLHAQQSGSDEWTQAFRVAADPVIAGAGDIACDPASRSFHGGVGSPSGRNCQERATSNLLVGADLSAVLTIGDEQYESAQTSAFSASFNPTWGRLGGLLRPAPGNHEFQVSSAGYFDYFNGLGHKTGPAGRLGQGWYSYDVGTWHLIALNSNCRYIGGCKAGSPEVRWLEADLKAHPARCTLAYWHHPRFSSGRHGDNTNMTPIWLALEHAHADVVLVGHDHDYERFAPQTSGGRRDYVDGIREFVVGTGGKSHDPFRAAQPNSQRRNANTYGVLELVLHPSSYDWRFVPVLGKRFADAGSGPCH
jgi:acid phosphatase type 7